MKNITSNLSSKIIFVVAYYRQSVSDTSCRSDPLEDAMARIPLHNTGPKYISLTSIHEIYHACLVDLVIMLINRPSLRLYPKFQMDQYI